MHGVRELRERIFHFEWENVASAASVVVTVVAVVIAPTARARKSVAGGDQTISFLVLAIRSINLFPMDSSAQKTSDFCSSLARSATELEP